uniref:Uncharacterized protein n=1 Tax=Ascaris lumbricoides TaxID=6252 RepID=A0A9J2PNX2_ASCLU
MGSPPAMELHSGMPTTNYSSQPSPVNYTNGCELDHALSALHFSAVATGFGVGCTTFHSPYNVQQPVQPTIPQAASTNRYDVLGSGGIPLVASPFQPYQWTANQCKAILISQSQRKALDMLALLFKLSDNHPVFQYYKLVHNPSNSPMKREDHSMKEEQISGQRVEEENGEEGVWHDMRATPNPMESNMFAEGVANPENISNENAFNWAFEGEDVAAAMNAPLDQIRPNHLEVENAREGSPLPSSINESLLESLEGIDMDESVGLSLESSGKILDDCCRRGGFAYVFGRFHFVSDEHDVYNNCVHRFR